jgi:hypothetical protein
LANKLVNAEQRKNMKKLNYWLPAIFIAVLVLSGALFAKAPQDAKSAPAVPGSQEMAKLKFYIGEWNYTESYEKTPRYPAGGKNTGLYTSTPGPGGNSLVQHFHSQGPMGDFEGLMIITWDTKESAYKEYIFGNAFPGCLVQTGQFEGDTLVFRGEVSMGATRLAMRNTTKLAAPNKIVSAEYVAVNGAPESLMLTVEASKK